MINVPVLMALPFLSIPLGIFLMVGRRRVVGKEHFLPEGSP